MENELNLSIKLKGVLARTVLNAERSGMAGSHREVVRLALNEFGQKHNLANPASDDEGEFDEQALAKITKGEAEARSGRGRTLSSWLSKRRL